MGLFIATDGKEEVVRSGPVHYPHQDVIIELYKWSKGAFELWQKELDKQKIEMKFCWIHWVIHSGDHNWDEVFRYLNLCVVEIIRQTQIAPEIINGLRKSDEPRRELIGHVLQCPEEHCAIAGLEFR